MRIKPLSPVINPNEGFTTQNDIFGYQGFGQRLTNLVQNLEQPNTIVLDGAWGTGKTTFIHQWAGSLRKENIPVIHFDAFANDYQENAFLALAGEITAATKTQNKSSSTSSRQFVDKAAKVGKALLPLAARIAVKTVTAGILSAEDFKNAKDSIEDGVMEAGNAAEQALDKLIKEKLQGTAANRNLIESFREDLENLTKELGNSSTSGPDVERNRPLVFIIDELDRCKPSFAVALLEQIKHIFATPNICFVVVTNLSHLETVFKGIYGQEMDAGTYLHKFYDLHLSLPKIGAIHGQSNSKAYIFHLWQSMKLESEDGRFDEDLRKILTTWANSKALTLRDIERITTYLVLYLASTNSRQLRLPPLVIGLALMKVANPKLYDKARTNKLTWQAAKEFLQLNDPEVKRDDNTDWYAMWWRYTTDDPLPDADWVKRCYGTLANYNVFNTSELLPFIANEIDNLPTF